MNLCYLLAFFLYRDLKKRTLKPVCKYKLLISGDELSPMQDLTVSYSGENSTYSPPNKESVIK